MRTLISIFVSYLGGCKVALNYSWPVYVDIFLNIDTLAYIALICKYRGEIRQTANVVVVLHMGYNFRCLA